MADKVNYDEEAKEIVGSLKEYKDQKICSLSPSTHQLQTTLCEKLKFRAEVEDKAKSATAKDILLLAKWIASQKAAEFITLEHTLKASVNFEITDDELNGLLGETPEHDPLEAVDEKIKEAQNIDEIKFNDSFKDSELKKWLFKNKDLVIGSQK